jgi:HAD superfamily hydrolase (TIGR01509 family)
MSDSLARAVIFDLDGTLLDSMSGFRTIINVNLKKRGINASSEAMREMGLQLLEKYQAPQSTMGIRLVFGIFWTIGRKMGLGFMKSTLFAIDCLVEVKEVYRNAPLFPEAKESLSKLSTNGFKLGICTSASRKQLIASLDKHGIRYLFHPPALVSRDDVSQVKPDPEGVLLAIKACSALPDDSFFIGDMPMDIEAGNSAGSTTIGVTTGLVNESLFVRYSEPTVIMHSLKEAIMWIITSNRIK